MCYQYFIKIYLIEENCYENTRMNQKDHENKKGALLISAPYV